MPSMTFAILGNLMVQNWGFSFCNIGYFYLTTNRKENVISSFVHLDETALVYAHCLAAQAPHLAIPLIQTPDFVDPVAVAAQHLALAQFLVAPQFCSTSCAFDNKHSELPRPFSCMNEESTVWRIG